MTNSRQKGKTGERYFAKRLRPIFPNIQRNAGEQARNGGVDLVNTGCFDFECKVGKAYCLKKVRDILTQAESQGSPCNYKIALVKPDREAAYALIPFTDFVELLIVLKAEDII